MPVLLHQQPVLTLALDSFQDTTIDENDIRRMWIIFTKCKDDIKNGFRLENISWRIWYKKYLNNTSDLFSNDKEYSKKQAMDDSSSDVHSVDSSSNFSSIEPIEVLKKCACGEQLISSSLNSLSTPHSEYTCFDKQICIHHHQKSNNNEVESTNTISKESSQKTLVVENQNTTIDNEAEETVVEVSKDETISIPATETTATEENTSPKEGEEENEENGENNEKKEIEKEEAVSTINTNNSNSTNTTKDTDTTTATIPPNCPTIEQFYQKQILLLQQVYLQKQQQLQYQKQQMTISQEQMYQHQMYLQQWYNQQQQQLMANCATYYNKYLQQHFGQAISQPTTTTESTQQPSNQTSSDQALQTKYIEDEEDYEDEDDDDYYYSDEDIIDEDDVDVDDDDDYIDNEGYQDEKENEPVEDDLFKKVATPKLKKEMAKPSLLSAMIKESTYNEYKKTVEYIQKYDDDAQRSSNNIYSIKDYNRNCINSLNKNDRRKRAPSFEDVRNAHQNLRKLIEMHPIYQSPSAQETNGNEDVEEYYEKGNNQFNNTTTNPNSYSTINTMASQDSHSTACTNHSSHYGVYGSNKTTHSNHSSKSQGPHHNRASNNNSVNLYMNKKR